MSWYSSIKMRFLCRCWRIINWAKSAYQDLYIIAVKGASTEAHVRWLRIKLNKYQHLILEERTKNVELKQQCLGLGMSHKAIHKLEVELEELLK